MLIVLFVLAIGANALVGRLGGLSNIKRRERFSESLMVRALRQRCVSNQEAGV